jgi:hypothetical protein
VKGSDGRFDTPDDIVNAQQILRRVLAEPDQLLHHQTLNFRRNKPPRNRTIMP